MVQFQALTQAAVSSTSTNVVTSAASKATEIASKTFGQCVQDSLIQSTANVVVSSVMDGVPIDKLLTREIISAAISAAAAYGAGQIGHKYLHKKIGTIEHKIYHGLLGAGLGASIAGLDKRDAGLGALSGMMGAVVAEIVAELTAPSASQTEVQSSANEGLSREEFASKFSDQVKRSTNYGNLSAAISAFALGLEVDIAHATAVNVTSNNHATMMAVMQESALDIYDEIMLERLEAAEVSQLELERLEAEELLQIESSINQHDRALNAYVDQKLKEREKFFGRPLRASSIKMVTERATELFISNHGAVETVRALGNPRNVLAGAAYAPSVYGIAASAAGTVLDTATGKLTLQEAALEMATLGSGAVSKPLKGWQRLRGIVRANQLAAHNRVNRGEQTGVTRESVRSRLFGTDNIFQFRSDRVRPIGAARPRNHEFAGNEFKFDRQYLSKRLKDVTDIAERREITRECKGLQMLYPHGVPFTGSGFPDFSRY